MAEKSMMAPPDSAAMPLSKPLPDVAEKPVIIERPVIAEKPAAIENLDPPEKSEPQVAAVQASPALPDGPAIPVQRTEFGVDLGGANSIDGLRALWRGMVGSNKALGGLRPIIVLRERANGLGMQLRLVAGPLNDAAAAAKLCAALSTGGRSCETSVFDGQRLALKSETAPKTETTATLPPPAAPARPTKRKPRGPPPVEPRSEAPAAKPDEPAPKPQSSLTSFIGIR
jgi:hypothetical protein